MRLYLDLLADIYILLPKPSTNYKKWHEVLDKGLKDLIDNPGCWSQVAGQQYLNAYVSDHETPPEIMVQLAVLLPLLDYTEWSGKELEITKTIKENLPTFYDEKLLARNIGIRFNGAEKTTVDEYCVSEGWIRVPAGNAKDRRGNPMTLKLKGPVEVYLRDPE